nr:transporter substrate-binding protein [uncultured Agrobacterium sp.]
MGTIISVARKGALPLVEKHDVLLWCMCPYESFEANEVQSTPAAAPTST